MTRTAIVAWCCNDSAKHVSSTISAIGNGLATYGYSQNDCDQILQNEAFRLCLYFSNGSKADGGERCQTDSKMILAGVSFGGADAYRAWDRSTYFEFEGDPWRSSSFSVSGWSIIPLIRRSGQVPRRPRINSS